VGFKTLSWSLESTGEIGKGGGTKEKEEKQKETPVDEEHEVPESAWVRGTVRQKGFRRLRSGCGRDKSQFDMIEHILRGHCKP
jgi:hypothetical protein